MGDGRVCNRGRPRRGPPGRALRAVALAAVLACALPWGAPGAPFAAASGPVCGSGAGGGSAFDAQGPVALDARRALWLVRRASGDVPACGVAAEVSRPPAWVRLDWAVVRPLPDDEACAGGRPACGPGALPRTRVLLADASGLRALLVDADGRVTPDAVDPVRDTPPAVPRIDQPAPRAAVGAPLVVRGVATGDWYFEGDLPISVVDATGHLLARGVAVAQGSWMTPDPVAFEATFDTLPASGFPPLALVLERDDPSDIPWHRGALVVPLTAVAP